MEFLGQERAGIGFGGKSSSAVTPQGIPWLPEAEGQGQPMDTWKINPLLQGKVTVHPTVLLQGFKPAGDGQPLPQPSTPRLDHSRLLWGASVSPFLSTAGLCKPDKKEDLFVQSAWILTEMLLFTPPKKALNDL